MCSKLQLFPAKVFLFSYKFKALLSSVASSQSGAIFRTDDYSAPTNFCNMRIAAFERDKQKTTNLLTTTPWGERKATFYAPPGFNSAFNPVLECFDFELLLWRVEFNGKETERADNRVKNLADKSMGFHLSGSVWTCFLTFTGSRMELTMSGWNQSQMYVHMCDSSPRLVTPCSDDNYLDKEEYCRDLSCPESLFVTANVSTTIIAKEHKLGVALLFLYPGVCDSHLLNC